MQTRTLVLTIVTLAALLAPVGAQQAVEPNETVAAVVRSAITQPKTGTARIAGRVLAADTGLPVRRAQVRITGPDLGSRATVTDADGRFEFRELPAGRVNLMAAKSGYVNVQYGQTKPFEAGRVIELAEKQVVNGADMTLPRGGVIWGRIVDEFGEPVPDVMVNAVRQTWISGRRRLVPAGRAAGTNDLGQFRIYGLPPGEYYVSAVLRNTEFSGMASAALPMPGPATGVSTPTSGYAPTFYPGSPTAATAQRVTVTIGHDAANVDFPLLPVRLARISGTVLTADGKPMEAAVVTAVPANPDAGIGPMALASSTRASSDGSFSISGIAPGDYILQARAMQIMTSQSGDRMSFTTRMDGPGAESEVALLPVAIAGEDLPNVLIVSARGAVAGGRVTFEGGTQTPPPPAIRLTAVPMEEVPMMPAPSATVAPDGAFELRGLLGRRMLRAMNLPPRWMVKAVRFNGEDVTDSGVDFKPGQDVSGLEVVVTSRTTEVTGGVTDAKGTPVKEYTVVIFAEEAELWTLPLTRWVTGARPVDDGRFRVRNMPAGTYLAAAVDYLEGGSWGDPELLHRLKPRARRLTVAEGRTETLDLKVVDPY